MSANNKIKGNVWELETLSLVPYYRSYLGNGYLGVQVSQDGTGVAADPPVRSFIAGVYDGEYEQLVEIPRWSGIGLFNGKGWLTFDEPEKITGYRQTLDMKRACLRTQYTWEYRGRATDFDITFFISREDAHLAVLRFSIVPHYEGEIVLENSLNADALDNLNLQQRGSEAGDLWLEVMTRTSNVRIAQVLGISCPDKLTGFKQEVDSPGSKQIRQRLRFKVEEGRRYTVYKYVSLFTSYDLEDPLRGARQRIREAESQGYDRLLKAHCDAWNELWESDILVDDHKLQRRIHSAFYHLLSSVREGQDHSIPPMGLSEDGWGGHIFWDAEVFMLPALLLLHPELAKSMVMYRYRTLGAARANATEQGYEGAAYGWQTGRTGKEASRGGPSKEIHITGDVAWGQWQYYLATQDRGYLENYAGQIIIETAKFWASRVTYNENADRYEILGVVPPDESTCEVHGLPTVDNSVFTNAIAQWNLRTAVKVCEILGRDYPAAWKEIADRMYLPFNQERQIYLEYDGYSGHPIKQPDVGEMIFLLEHPMSQEIIAANFDYYREKADRELGHSFFPSVHPIVACRLGRRQEAYELFVEWDGFFLPPFEVMRECLCNEGIVFLTSFGGFLQNFLYGFGGIRIGEDGLKVQPLLPDEFSRIIFKRIFYGGKAYRLIVEKKGGQDSYELKE
ncbi:MAG TPA: glycoside hydrolase family 65 protein [Candidatus Latescibacteria bacterium]|nr:glycoside hydrolase family 65 protein [Candidatus Latescibacterota bacterium]